MALSREQREIRRIGGSSSAKVLGVSKYGRPEELRREVSYSLYGRESIEKWLVVPEDSPFTKEELIDKKEKEFNTPLDNIHVRVGTFMEGLVRERLKKKGVNIRVKNKTLVHPEHPYITANIDGRESGTVEEIKCISVYRKKEFGDEFSDQIPLDYAAQCNHYMLFPNFNHARLRCLFLTEAEKEFIDRMVRWQIVDQVKKKGLWLKEECDKYIEVDIPKYGPVEWNFEKQKEYESLPKCKLNMDALQSLVDIAPLMTYELHEDKETAANFLREYSDFWHRAKNNIPCVARTLEDCQIRFGGYSSKKTKIASDFEKRLKAERDMIVARKKKGDERLKEISAQLMVEAGDADRVQGEGGTILYGLGQKWSPTKDPQALYDWAEEKAKSSIEPVETILDGYMKPNVVDWDKVKKEIPEVYAKCRVKTARNIIWPRGK